MSDTLIVDITALAHDGRGIARQGAAAGDENSGGAVVFVAHALPGQRVRARLLRRKARFMEAETLELLRPAPDAVAPICPHQTHCGGCPLQTMPYARQLQWKRTLALDALERVGGLERPLLEGLLPEVRPSPALRNCRNKMEFAFGSGADGAFVLGLRRRNGRDVTPVPGCVLMPPEAQEMAALACAAAGQSGLPAYLPPEAARHRARAGDQPAGLCPEALDKAGGSVRRPGRGGGLCRAPQKPAGFWRFFVLRRGLAADLRSPRWWALCITSQGSAAERAEVRAMGRRLLAAFPSLAGFMHEERVRDDALAQGQRRVLTLNAAGRPDPSAARLYLPLGESFFALDAASFFQVNTAAAQTLARLAVGMLRDAAADRESDGAQAGGLLDLYCGVGAPGLLAASGHAALLGLEQDGRAVRLARANAAALGFAHCRYVAGDAAALLASQAAHSGAGAQGWRSVLADPPRGGLAPGVLTALLDLAPRNILYISCNPATLARDAGHLHTAYALEQLAAVDIFPHTPHVECLSLWRRRACGPCVNTGFQAK